MENLVRKLITVLAINAFIISIIHTSYADQAALMPKEYIKKALDLIQINSEIRLYCAPCRDTNYESIHVKRKKIKLVHAMNNERLYQIVINNSVELDLAYTYINQKDLWKNLAILVGLKPQKVPEYLTEELLIEKKLAKKYYDNAISYTRKEHEHPIEKQLQEGLDSSGGSASIMAGCYYEAAGSWEKEMNKYYRLIMKNLEPPEQKTLKKAQKKWEKYCRSELDFISSIIGLDQGYFGGSYGGQFLAECEEEIYEQRAHKMMEYYKALNE